MYSVRSHDSISQAGLDELPAHAYSVGPSEPTPDAVLLRSFDLRTTPLPATVVAVARAGAGVNNIPVDECSRRGIAVFNTPGANANSVKELVICGMLLASRRIVEGITWTRTLAGASGDVPGLVERAKKRFSGPEIMGKTLGVIGLGAIGVAVANAASALGMRVVGHDPFITVTSAWGLTREVERAGDLEDLLRASEYVTVHAPLNDRTRNLIGEARFAQMKPGARLLNFARGGLVERGALLESLASGRLASYVTDFVDAELAAHPKVLPVPHLGASTPEAEANCARMAARQLRQYLERGIVANSVNFPEVLLPPRPDAFRIQIVNRNEPDMIRRLAAAIAKNGTNIANLVNKGRGTLAYNVIDVGSEVDQGLLMRLRAIDGVVRVRSPELPPERAACNGSVRSVP